MARVDPVDAPDEPEWRTRAIARSLDVARSRAEERVQRFLEAAFELIDEKGSTEFTIQEVVDRSKQSLRGFYEYFDSKDELVLALFEETVREAVEDIRAAVDAETDPLARLRAFAITLHEWCDPTDAPRKRGRHSRRAIAEFSTQLTANHAERVRATLRPQARLLRELVTEADDAGVIHVGDIRRAATLMQTTVMYSSFGNRIVENPAHRLSAEATWEFCRDALNA